MTHRDLARVLAGDTSRDLIDSTAILSCERTNYVIEDEINDIYVRTRMSARHIIQTCSPPSPPSPEFLRKMGNFYIHFLQICKTERLPRKRKRDTRVIAL